MEIQLEASQYFTPAELCARYKGLVSERTLANWRSRGEGPSFVKIGGRVLYRAREVALWESRRLMRPSS